MKKKIALLMTLVGALVLFFPLAHNTGVKALEAPVLRERVKYESIQTPAPILFAYRGFDYGEVKESYVINCTDEELELLASAIYHEVGNCSYDLKLKVGSVVLNRVTEQEYFPDTIHDVVYQEDQFNVFTAYSAQMTTLDIYPDGYNEDSMKAAREILIGGSVLPERVQVFYLLGTYDPWLNSRETYSVEEYDVVFAYID